MKQIQIEYVEAVSRDGADTQTLGQILSSLHNFWTILILPHVSRNQWHRAIQQTV